MRSRLIACSILLLLILSGCGPTAEDSATMTAAASTATPPPTPTATPIPYDLTVHVLDESGSPIQGASIVLPESGSKQPVQTDASGTYTWKNLPGAAGNLEVSAPGYHHALQSVTLERGPTEMALVLRRDPFALLGADACAPDEKLLYMQDFQSGQAPEWSLVAGEPNGWGFATKEEGNNVASFTGVGQYQAVLNGYTFDNVVWRLKVRVDGGDGDSFLNLKQTRDGTDKRYVVQWGPASSLGLTRLEAVTGAASPGATPMAGGRFRAKQGTWYYFEVGNYQGLVQVWVDGKKQIEAQDAAPLPAGTISLEAHVKQDPQTAYSFDNLSVCELSAPFSSSLYKPPAQ